MLQACSSQELPQLPNNLMQTVLAMSWSARPRPRTASEEVRHALQLRGLSRGISKLLQAQPLLLDLNFKDTLLSPKHLKWLASPAWTKCVEALTLFGWEGDSCSGDGGVLVKGLCEEKEEMYKLLDVLHPNQRRSLKCLFGAPLLLGPPGPSNFHHADISGFSITDLGVNCVTGMLVPPRLPPTLTSIICCHHYREPEEGCLSLCWNRFMVRRGLQIAGQTSAVHCMTRWPHLGCPDHAWRSRILSSCIRLAP